MFGYLFFSAVLVPFPFTHQRYSSNRAASKLNCRSPVQKAPSFYCSLFVTSSLAHVMHYPLIPTTLPLRCTMVLRLRLRRDKNDRVSCPVVSKFFSDDPSVAPIPRTNSISEFFFIVCPTKSAFHSHFTPHPPAYPNLPAQYHPPPHHQPRIPSPPHLRAPSCNANRRPVIVISDPSAPAHGRSSNAHEDVPGVHGLP